MSKIEMGSPWTGREGVENFLKVQDIPVDLSKLTVKPAHAHFADDGEFDKQPIELQNELISIIESNESIGDRRVEVNGVYSRYLVSRGVDGQAITYFDENDPYSTFGVDVEFKGCNPDLSKVIEMFPMVDYLICYQTTQEYNNRALRAGFLFKDKDKDEGNNVLLLGFYANGTRINAKSSEYRMDLAIGANLERNYDNLVYGLLIGGIPYYKQVSVLFGNPEKIDLVEPSALTQRTMEELLADRVS